MGAAVDLPVLPTARAFQREAARRRIARRHADLDARHLTVTLAQTAVYLSCRRWFRAAVIRNDFRHARRLTLAERLGLTFMRAVKVVAA